jgi:hypothetical protein
LDGETLVRLDATPGSRARRADTRRRRQVSPSDRS